MTCCPNPEGWVARAQAWLGTLVEVALPQQQASAARFAAAFAAVADVHVRLHTHGRRSELVRIARHAHRREVIVSRDTHALLRLAQRLSLRSGGCFAPLLRDKRARRCRIVATRAPHHALAALRLLPGRRVRTLAPLHLDFSGIAKGHAVDRAVAALRAAGASAGLVNAGGDLRVFGDALWLPVRVRLPGQPSLALPLFELCNAAAATSADYFREHAATLFDPGRARQRPFTDSFSVVAPSCALADALTKVVALRPRRALAWLAGCGAHAFRLSADGHAAFTTLAADTAQLRLPSR